MGSPWAAHSSAHWAAHYFSYLQVVGCLLSCSLFPYMEVVVSLICMPTPLPTELPTVSIYGRSGQPNFRGKILMGSPFTSDSAAHYAAHFFIFGSSGLPTELSTELPTVSIYGGSEQPNLHGKILMGGKRAAHSVAHVQSIGSEVGSSTVFFLMGVLLVPIFGAWRKHVVIFGRHNWIIYFV